MLFTTWHAQYNAGVDAAQKALAGRTVRRLLVTWKEDVRRWHPGQTWIWQAGGFGVFDPGINALSIVTRILPAADLCPEGRPAIPVECGRADRGEPRVLDRSVDEDLRAEFDWRQTGPQTWDIEVGTTDGGMIALRQGGSRLEVDGKVVVDAPSAEYPGVYARFDALLRAGQSEVDAAPLRLAADAFLLARRIAVEAFEP